jgi:hypothetical protein
MKLYIWTSLAGAYSAKNLLSTPPHGDQGNRALGLCLHSINLVRGKGETHYCVSAEK